MNKRYFEVSAKHMANFGIEGPRVFEVIEVETNMIGGKGFDAFITLDTPAMMEDCFIGTKLVVAAARGRFVDAPASEEQKTAAVRIVPATRESMARDARRWAAGVHIDPRRKYDEELRKLDDALAKAVSDGLPKGGGLLGASVRQMIIEHRLENA